MVKKKKCFTKVRENDTEKGKAGTTYQGCAMVETDRKSKRLKEKAKKQKTIREKADTHYRKKMTPADNKREEELKKKGREARLKAQGKAEASKKAEKPKKKKVAPKRKPAEASAPPGAVDMGGFMVERLDDHPFAPTRGGDASSPHKPFQFWDKLDAISKMMRETGHAPTSAQFHSSGYNRNRGRA